MKKQGAPRITEACACCGQLFEQTGRKRICSECFMAGQEDEKANRQWFLGFDCGRNAARAMRSAAEQDKSPFAIGFRAGFTRGAKETL